MATEGYLNTPEIFESMDYGTVLESDEIAKHYLENHGKRLKPFVRRDLRENQIITEEVNVFNPCTGEELCVVCIGKDYLSGFRAERKWAELEPKQRVECLYSASKCIETNQKLLAMLESISTGRLFRYVHNVQVPNLVRSLRQAADEVQLRDRQKWRHIGRGEVWISARDTNPFFTHPWQIFGILAAGNSVVMTIWHEHFLSTLLICELLEEAGVPDGVLNVCPGHSCLNVIQHFDKILCFDCDYLRFARKQYSCTLPNRRQTVIVFDTASLNSAAEGTVEAMRNSVYGVKLLVQESVFKKFLPILEANFLRLRVGSCLDKNADVTPVFVDTESHDDRRMLLKEFEDQGAKILELEVSGLSSELYYSPILIQNFHTSSPTMLNQKIYRHSILVLPFRTVKEAVALANHSPPGGEAILWTERTATALEVARLLTFASIRINSTNVEGDTRHLWQKGFYTGTWFDYVKPNVEASVTEIPQKISDNSLVQRSIFHEIYYGGKRHMVTDGATGKYLSKAISAARSALADWSRLPSYERGVFLHKIADGMEQMREKFIEALDQKSSDPQGDFDSSIDALYKWAATCREGLCGNVVDTGNSGLTSVIHEPVGVIGISLTNHSLLSYVTTLAAAVSYGNCVVTLLEQNFSDAALPMFVVFENVSLPAGVINVLILGDDYNSTYLDVDAAWMTQADDDEGSDTIHSNVQTCTFVSDVYRWPFCEIVSIFRAIATRRKSIQLTAGDIFAN